MLVILWGLSGAFWNMARFINQSFISYFEAKIACRLHYGDLSVFLFKYFFFYILIISNYFRKDKLFILIVVTLYKNLPKTVILRGHVFVFLHII